jgi:membrane protein
LLIVIRRRGLVFGHDAVRGEIVHQLGGVMGRDGATAVQGASQERVRAQARIRLLGRRFRTADRRRDDRVCRVAKRARPDLARSRERTRRAAVWNLLRTRFLSFGLVLGLGFLMLMIARDQRGAERLRQLVRRRLP